MTEFTENNINELMAAETPIMVDFWASWCGPCKTLLPVIEVVAKEYEGKVIVGKLNVDEHPAIATKYGIRSLPTILIFKNGEIVDKMVGMVSKGIIINKLNEILKK